MNLIKYKQEFLQIVDDIINHPEFLKSKNIKHHNESIFEHSLDVAHKSYLIAKKKGLDYVSVARGGLLHDFFLYDWRTSGNRHILNFGNMHAISHPKKALENAQKYFQLNDIEKDIIVKHMFPATLIPPKYKESWIVSIVDKQLAVKEYVEEFSKPLDTQEA